MPFIRSSIDFCISGVTSLFPAKFDLKSAVLVLTHKQPFLETPVLASLNSQTLNAKTKIIFFMSNKF
jgi:hypothetical protein